MTPTDTPQLSNMTQRFEWGAACRSRHPYYFLAHGFSAADPGNRALHRLCSLLNHHGVESWMVTTDTAPDLWTPKVSDPVRAAHHATHRVPIVVYCDPILGSTADLGIKVCYQFCITHTPSSHPTEGSGRPLAFAYFPSPPEHGLRLPFWPPGSVPGALASIAPRPLTLAWAPGLQNAEAAQNTWPQGTRQLTAKDLQDEATLWLLLQQAQVLYLHDLHPVAEWARLAGCAVVHVVPNEANASAAPQSAAPFGQIGWFERHQAVPAAELPAWSANAHRQAVTNALDGWQADVARFIDLTQQAAADWGAERAWPEKVVLGLPTNDQRLEVVAQRADRLKALRVDQQLTQWRARSSLREIDADIYAQHIASGQLPPVAAVIYADTNMDALADTLDSLAQSWLQPTKVMVISSLPSPFASGDEPPGLVWHTQTATQAPRTGGSQGPISLLTKASAPWTLVTRAGTILEPHSLIEWTLATRHTTARLIYADEDVRQGDVFAQPHFKPHPNLEWLRSCNHLGDAVLVESRSWHSFGGHHCFDGVYSFALRMVESYGLQALAHVDSLLFHGTGRTGQDQLDAERSHVEAHLQRCGLATRVQATGVTGVHTIQYLPPALQVTLVVPSATQTGYLDCLLQSLLKYPAPQLAEVLVVCDHEHDERIRPILAGINGPFSVRCVSIANQPYSHGKALNAGLHAAQTELIAFADDDTELVHPKWLEPLAGYFQQPQVAVVAPRLAKPGTPEPILSAGPVFLGLAGLWAPYTGEKGNVLEAGPYGRLQAAQDVSAWAPSFFMARAQTLRAVDGFDEVTFGLFYTVLDLALRLQSSGERCVWTPQTTVLHQGGKTLEDRQRQPEQLLNLRQAELAERQKLTQKWTHALGADPHYNRNLSLAQPFDLEQDVVVDWQPGRHDRPRALALPLSSGSGQYRVIEPLHALQNASLAQSVVVMPISRDVSRVPTSIELVRSKLDRLIVQNAIGDLHMARLEEYRKNLPELGIIHMMDDLFGNLPGKHHLHHYHKREGSARIRRALELSDRLVVTTEPLRDYYQAFVPDTRIVPNALVEENWFDLPVTRRSRNSGRLRIGWAGAQQHLGDLDMIAEVVAHLAPQVDWIFMGMCPPSIRPHVKEVHPFVSISVYPQTLANLDLDVAIAPLEDNPFNACKSNLRLLEYGSMGWPVVCSDVFPYRTENPPVIRVANESNAWIDALQRVIDNPALRREIGQGLNHWVKSRFALSLHVDAWFHAIFDPVQRH